MNCSLQQKSEYKNVLIVKSIMQKVPIMKHLKYDLEVDKKCTNIHTFIQSYVGTLKSLAGKT